MSKEAGPENSFLNQRSPRDSDGSLLLWLDTLDTLTVLLDSSLRKKWLLLQLTAFVRVQRLKLVPLLNSNEWLISLLGRKHFKASSGSQSRKQASNGAG